MLWDFVKILLDVGLISDFYEICRARVFLRSHFEEDALQKALKHE